MTNTHLTRRVMTQFGPQSTAAEVIAGIELAGERAIVTGASSGIGVETARVLAGANAEVTLAVRNLEAGERTAEDIIASTGIQQDPVSPLNLADQASVVSFVANWDGPQHLLVNNAGIMASPLMRTPGGGRCSSQRRSVFNQPGWCAALLLDPIQQLLGIAPACSRLLSRGPAVPSVRAPEQTQPEAAMQAVVVDEYGGAPMLAELPKPRSGPGQVLTKLLAAEMSPLDRKLVSGDRRSAGGVRDGARR